MRTAFLAAIVLLAAIFTLSCYEEIDGCSCAEENCVEDSSLLNPCGDAWYKPSLSEYCFEGIVKEKEIYADPRDGREYKTVAIGAQTWMAENLNYNVTGSKCYSNLESKCNTYGRLYDWAAALDVCPAGWHLPSDEEWTVLTDYAGGASIAGKKLKAASGWILKGGQQYSNAKLKSMNDYVVNDCKPCGSNGTDDYGFSALPGGSYIGYFKSNDFGFWWSATEFTDSAAYYRSMYDISGEVVRFSKGKAEFLSVRCVKDVPETDRLDN